MEEGLRVLEAGKGHEHHVRHVRGALLDARICPVGLAHKDQTGLAHGARTGRS